jgi:hypothetical protein
MLTLRTWPADERRVKHELAGVIVLWGVGLLTLAAVLLRALRGRRSHLSAQSATTAKSRIVAFGGDKISLLLCNYTVFCNRPASWILWPKRERIIAINGDAA